MKSRSRTLRQNVNRWDPMPVFITDFDLSQICNFSFFVTIGQEPGVSSGFLVHKVASQQCMKFRQDRPITTRDRIREERRVFHDLFCIFCKLGSRKTQ